MNVGILGGSFNPPHIGHILVAQQVLDFFDFDVVWWLPDYLHSFDKPLASIEHRLAMLKSIDIPKTQLSTVMVDYQLDGNTINLVPILKKEFPHDSFTFIIGSDQLPTFTKWGSWQKLLRQMPFLVVPRAGYPTNPLFKGMKLLGHPLFITTNISSSMVRERIKKNLSIDHLVNEGVKEYIEKHKLYK